jgi:cytochrome c oxidase assembly protein subunit 11
MNDKAAPQSRRRDLMVAGSAGVFAAFMVGMAYAAVPLYDWFCRATGFGGTTQVSTAAPAQALDRKVMVRFDANIGAGLPWRFEPEHTSIEARLGEVVTMNYRAINLTARETHGIAGYNVTPLSMGIFFQKINCFCFTDQTLKAGEKRDADGKDVDTITLSYTFHPQRELQRPVANNAPVNRAGRI